MMARSKRTKARQSRGGDRPSTHKQAEIPRDDLLIAVLSDVRGRRILCTSQGRAQFAAAAAEALPEAEVYCHFLDVYQAELARQVNAGGPSNLTIACSADLPGGDFDVVAFPFHSGGEAELTRDLMQSGFETLHDGGRMIASTNNPKDTWLHEQMQTLFDKVTRREIEREGVIYLGTKTKPLKKRKNFQCEFAFRDRETLVQAVSRPGVFSHRKLDGGARALINSLNVRDGERVFDIGCGCGAVGFAAAMRAEGVHVYAVDSNARAVQCAARGAELNSLGSYTVLLDARGRCDALGTYDLAVGNPPYFSNYRIAEIFLQAAMQALKPDGRIHVVAKHVDWYVERMQQLFDGVAVDAGKNYSVIVGTRRES